MLWALRPALEEALKTDKPTFEVSQQRRAAKSESCAAEAPDIALAPELLLKNLNFATAAANGETDVLARVDDFLLVVEAKSGVLPTRPTPEPALG